MRRKTSNAATQTVSPRHCISMQKMVTSARDIQRIKKKVKSIINVNLYDEACSTLFHTLYKCTEILMLYFQAYTLSRRSYILHSCGTIPLKTTYKNSTHAYNKTYIGPHFI